MTIRPFPAALLSVVAVGSVAALAPACGGGGGGGISIDPELRRALVADLAEDVIFPTYQSFLAEAMELEEAIAAYAASLSTEDRDAARAAFLEAMAVWQRVELMQVGPVGSSLTTVGGEDLRDQIYSWPVVSACRVDQELVSGDYQDVDTFASELVNVRGLDAMEYLLFFEGDTNACSATAAINTDGSWTAIVPELAQRRADYAHTLAVLVERQAQALVDRFSPTGGNFLAELVSAGAGGTVYDNAQHAMNAITNGMFYLDTVTKDRKIAQPAGISMCEAASCPDAVESPWSNESLSNIEQNLLAFQMLFLGGPPGTEANGFDDLLVAVGQADLATRMETAFANAIAALEPVDGTLRDAVQNDHADVEALYAAVQEATSLLKNEFLPILDLQRPLTGASDND